MQSFTGFLRRAASVPATSHGSRRHLTASEAAVALRPFYFAVHPDRFARVPEIRQQNERSLQAFNGYLNSLYVDRVVADGTTPLKLKFSVWNKKAEIYEAVALQLVGRDPSNVVRTALESCKLPTTHLPKKPAVETTPWDDAMMRIFLRKRKANPGMNVQSNFFDAVGSMREKARTANDAHSKTRKLVDEEIADLLLRTKLRDITWVTDWTLSHMRGCLSALHRLLDLANADGPEAVAVLSNAMQGQILKFGTKGSYTACDGSLHFGVDDSPQQWEQACSEAPIRITQLPLLDTLETNLGALLGGASVVRNPDLSVTYAIDWLQTLIVRTTSTDRQTASELRSVGRNTQLHVISGYGGLALGNNGVLFVPCNTDAVSLLRFMRENCPKARSLAVEREKIANELAATADACRSRLSLRALTWDSTKALRKPLIGRLNTRIPRGSPVIRRPADRTLPSPVEPNRLSPVSRPPQAPVALSKPTPSSPSFSRISMSGLAQDIKNRQAEFMKHFNAGNAANAAELYDPDGYFAPHGRDPVKGRAGIESYFKQDMAEGVKSVQIITEEVNGSGDWAFERGSYHLQGNRGTESGAYLLVWKKVDGTWLIHNDCFNVIKPAQG
uniref:DUF4440 domain-containing protein n=1 Tax=Plectus sambesii TaxID=2011161 RepID=A0A914X524_9BILA